MYIYVLFTHAIPLFPQEIYIYMYQQRCTSIFGCFGPCVRWRHNDLWRLQSGHPGRWIVEWSWCRKRQKIHGWDAGSPKRWEGSVASYNPQNWQEKYHLIHLYTTYSPWFVGGPHMLPIPPFRKRVGGNGRNFTRWAPMTLACWWLKSHSQPPGMYTLPETNNGWNTTFLLGRPIFRCYVSFREGKTL